MQLGRLNRVPCVSILSKVHRVVHCYFLPPAGPKKTCKSLSSLPGSGSEPHTERIVDSNSKVEGTDDDEVGKTSILLCILHAHANRKILAKTVAEKEIHCSIEHSRHDYSDQEGERSGRQLKGMMRKR